MNVGTKPIIELNGKQQQEYSIARAILAAADKKDCFELEVSNEIRRELGRGAGHGAAHSSIFVPSLLRAGLDSKTVTKGKELTFTEAGPFIQALRAKSVLLQLGATLLPGLKADLDLPRFDVGAKAEWQAENAIAVTETTPSTAKVPLKRKTLTSLVSFSRQLLVQSTPQIDQLLIESIAQANAAALDHAGLHGDGVNAPLGIFNQALASHTIAFAGAITFPKVCDMESIVGESNGETDVESMAFVTTPKVRSVARQTAKAATLLQPIWGDDNVMAGHHAEATTNAYNSAGDQTIVLGVWTELIVGEYGVLEIVFDPYSNKKQGVVELETFYSVDATFQHLESFAISSGLTAS